MIRFLDRLFGVFEDPRMPDDLKMGSLDRLDGQDTRRPVVCEVAV